MTEVTALSLKSKDDSPSSCDFSRDPRVAGAREKMEAAQQKRLSFYSAYKRHGYVWLFERKPAAEAGRNRARVRSAKRALVAVAAGDAVAVETLQQGDHDPAAGAEQGFQFADGGGVVCAEVCPDGLDRDAVGVGTENDVRADVDGLAGGEEESQCLEAEVIRRQLAARGGIEGARVQGRAELFAGGFESRRKGGPMHLMTNYRAGADEPVAAEISEDRIGGGVLVEQLAKIADGQACLLGVVAMVSTDGVGGAMAEGRPPGCVGETIVGAGDRAIGHQGVDHVVEFVATEARSGQE